MPRADDSLPHVGIVGIRDRPVNGELGEAELGVGPGEICQWSPGLQGSAPVHAEADEEGLVRLSQAFSPTAG